MNKVFVITIFPEIINCYVSKGIVNKALKLKKIEVEALNLRDFAKKRVVDDKAYGGFPGMVLKPEPIFKAYENILTKTNKKPFVIKTESFGRKIDQELINFLEKQENIVIICGRYIGIDERVSSITDLDVSLGEFILSGGEIAALAIIDALSRLKEGVLNKEENIKEDSYTNKWLGFPVYTRPRDFKGMKVPEVLLSGNHKLIKEWSLKERIKKTIYKNPKKAFTYLDKEEFDIINVLKKEGNNE